MNGPGDCPVEMRKNRSHDEASFEAALAGRQAAPEALAQLVAAVRADATTGPDPKIGPALAAVLEGDLAAEPSNQPIPIRRKKMPIPALLSTAAAKLAAAGVAATLTATGAAAATGNLPDAVQERVASAIEAVAPVDLPGNDNVNVAGHDGGGDHGNATSAEARANKENAKTFVQNIDTETLSGDTKGASGDARDTFQPTTPAPEEGSVAEEGEQYDADNNPGADYSDPENRPSGSDASDSGGDAADEAGPPEEPGGDRNPSGRP